MEQKIILALKQQFPELNDGAYNELYNEFLVFAQQLMQKDDQQELTKQYLQVMDTEKFSTIVKEFSEIIVP